MVVDKDRAKKFVRKASKILSSSSLINEYSGRTISAGGERFKVFMEWSCRLSEAQRQWAFELFRTNMKDFYVASQWGYDEHSKHQELEAMTARYLILHNAADRPVAYVHYRFVVEEGRPVLYCYEIQVEKDYQHKGLGSAMLDILEALAKRTDMEKIMATVFTHNPKSLAFFRKLGFAEDELSPDPESGIDYVILYKQVKS